MAEADFMPVRDIPVLTIPDIGVEEHGYALRFRIATAEGVIDVEGRHTKWRCTGCAEALSEARLIDIAWLPGVQGNNKVSQTVVFSDGVAAPYRGNPKGRNLGNHIRIKRVSSHRFEVEIPPTNEQAEKLKDLWWQECDRLIEDRQRRQHDEAIEAAARNKTLAEAAARNMTPDEVRDYIHWLLRGLSGLADSYARHAGFQIDPASKRIFDQHIAILHDVIQNAGIERVPSEFTGNVVPFGPRR